MNYHGITAIHRFISQLSRKYKLESTHQSFPIILAIRQQQQQRIVAIINHHIHHLLTPCWSERVNGSMLSNCDSGTNIFIRTSNDSSVYTASEGLVERANRNPDDRSVYIDVINGNLMKRCLLL